MATIVNDRDNILLNTTPRLIATTVVISGDGSSFTKLKNNGGVNPTTILLTANTTVFTSPTFSWEYALSSTPGTWVSMGSGPTQTITGTTFATLLGTTNTHANYRVTATQTGFLSSTSPVFTITYFRESDDSVVVNITRKDTTVNTDAAGTFTPPAANSGTVISVTRGNTPLNYAASGPDSFSVSYTVTAGSVTYGSVTNSGTTSSYADITAMTTDTATVLFTVTVRDSAGTPTVYNVTQTFTKVKAPDAVYNHYLAPPSCFLDIDNSGNVISYADAFTQYNVFKGDVDDTSNWTFTKVDRNVTSTITSGGLVQITSFGVTSTPTWSAYGATGASSTLGISVAESWSNGHFYYAAGLYIFVPYPDTGSTTITSIYTSPDAQTWTARTVPAGNYYRAIYSPGLGYFVLGISNPPTTTLILKSSDGTSWSNTSLPTLTYYLTGFTLSGNLYLVPWDGAVTNNLSKYNGSSWSTVTTTGLFNPSPRYRHRAISNGSVSIILHNTNYNPYWSTNGTTWTASTGAFGTLGTGFSDITYDGSKFYVLAGGAISTSYDGKNWQLITPTISPTPRHFGFSNGKFYYVSNDILYAKQNVTDTVSGSVSIISGLGDGGNGVPCEYYNGIRPSNAIAVFHNSLSSGGAQYNVTRLVSNLDPPSNNIGYVDITATKGLLTRTLTFIVQKASATSDVYTTNIIPATTAFPANADGTVLSYTGSSSIVATIRKNGVDETSLWTATTSVSTGITLTGSWPTYAVTAVSGTVDTGTVTITATKGSMVQTLVWTYTKDKSGTGGGLIINSFNPIISIGAYVSLTFKTNGRVEIKLTSSESPRFLLNWIEPTSATVGNSYYIKATTTGDALASGTTGSYQQLNADRTWVLDNTAGISPSSKHTDFKLYLSTSASDAGCVGYATTYLQADKL